MDAYVEVVGQGTLTETVAEYRTDLLVTVRAAAGDAALGRATRLRDRCIRTLKTNGIKDSELTEGGGEIWRPWFWKRKPSQEVSHKILIACRDRERLFKALSALEPLFDNHSSLSVSMRQPRFEAANDDRAMAMSSAIADARSKAETVAREAGLRIMGVTQVEELLDRTERSGAYGDEDWRHGMVLADSMDRPDAAPEHLDAATRRTTVRCRVRFSVDKAV